MYSDFVFLDQFLFELSCKNTHTHMDTHTDTNTHTHTHTQNHSTVTILILFVYAFNRNIIAKLYLPSTFQTSDIELLSPKIET